MNEVLTHQARLQWLAEQVEECLNCNPVKGTHLTPIPHCFKCGGTGKVARFPMLRQDCDYCEGTGINKKIWIEDHYEPNGSDCSYCQGRGWLPVDDLAATAKSAYEFMHSQVSQTFWNEYQDACARGDNEGAVEAVYKAVKREGEA